MLASMVAVDRAVGLVVVGPKLVGACVGMSVGAFVCSSNEKSVGV